MRRLDATTWILALIGVALWVGGPYLSNNFDLDTPSWVLAVTATTIFVGPFLVETAASAAIISGALADWHADEMSAVREVDRLKCLQDAATAVNRVSKTLMDPWRRLQRCAIVLFGWSSGPGVTAVRSRKQDPSKPNESTYLSRRPTP